MLFYARLEVMRCTGENTSIFRSNPEWFCLIKQRVSFSLVGLSSKKDLVFPRPKSCTIQLSCILYIHAGVLLTILQPYHKYPQTYTGLLFC